MHEQIRMDSVLVVRTMSERLKSRIDIIAQFMKRDGLLSKPFSFFLLVFLLAGTLELLILVSSDQRLPLLPRIGVNVMKWTASPALNFFHYSLLSIFLGIAIIASTIHAEKANGSFRALLVLPLSREMLFWGRILSTALLCAMPLIVVYSGLWLLRSLNLIKGGFLIQTIAAFDFFALLLAIDFLFAVIFIGSSLLGDARVVYLIFMGLFFIPLLINIILNPFFTGLRRESAFPIVIRFLSQMENLIGFVVLLALLIGIVMSKVFRHKRTYV